MIAIIDYGMGNLRSVQKGLEKVGAKAEITSTPRTIAKADGVVLPGVGAMPDAMDALQKEKLVDVIYKIIENKKPFLGICLGLQLLFETSEEGGGCKGLGIFKGAVPRFNFSNLSTINNQQSTILKVPHMGWNEIKKVSSYEIVDSSQKQKRLLTTNSKLLTGISDNSYVYFVHSYYVVPEDKSIIATTTNYGIEFCSSIYKDNIFACQFHPEKSQKVGLKLLANFVSLCYGTLYTK